MASASAWKPRAAAGSWPAGVRRVASGCRHEAAPQRWWRMARAKAATARPARVTTLKRRAEYLRVRKGARWATPAFVLEAKARANEDRALRRRTSRGSGLRSPSRSARPSSAIASGGGSRRRSRTVPDPRQTRIRLCADRAPPGAHVGVRRPSWRELAKAFARVHRTPARGAAGRNPAEDAKQEALETPMDQDNQKNLLLAIVLSVAVLLVWQMFYAGPKLKEEQERRQRIQQEQSQGSSLARPRRPRPDPRSGTAAGRRCRPRRRRHQPLRREAACKAAPRVRIETPSLQRFDRAQGRAHRRSGAGQVPRDGRPKAPTSCCSRPPARPTPITPSTAGCGPGVDAADARPRHALAAPRRARR